MLYMGHCRHLITAKCLGLIGFTMIQIAYQIHKKLPVRLQHSHAPQTSPLKFQHPTKTTTCMPSSCHYNSSHR